MLTEDKVQQIFKHAEHHEVQEFVETFNNNAVMFGFETDFHVNAFLAQIEEEVGYHLAPKRENMNYSCHALKSLFGHYKHNPIQAQTDGRCNGHRANQRAIANRAYGGRIGNHLHNDGWMFRGGSYIQLTGRANYKQIADALTLAMGIPFTTEDLASEMNSVQGSLLASMAFFLTHKLYKAKTIDEMTAIVNAHTPTYAERKKHYLYIASL